MGETVESFPVSCTRSKHPCCRGEDHWDNTVDNNCIRAAEGRNSCNRPPEEVRAAIDDDRHRDTNTAAVPRTVALGTAYNPHRMVVVGWNIGDDDNAYDEPADRRLRILDWLNDCTYREDSSYYIIGMAVVAWRDARNRPRPNSVALDLDRPKEGARRQLA